MVNEPDEGIPSSRKPAESLDSSGGATTDSNSPPEAAHPSLNPPEDHGVPSSSSSDITSPVSSSSKTPGDNPLDETASQQDHDAPVAVAEEAPTTDNIQEEADTQNQDHEPEASDHHYHHSQESDLEDSDWSDGEEEGGGPVKSFLEHLEDFRWMIIRCLAALVIAMVVCLVAGNKVVELLKEPLQKAQALGGKIEKPVVLLGAGTNIWTVTLETNQFGPIPFGTNNALRFDLQPIQVGTNVVLGLKPIPARTEDIPVQNRITLKNFGPISPFVVALKIALFGGIGLASPFILLFVGQFIVPALHKHEKKYVFRAVAIGSLLFCCGVLFCYFFMLQIALNAAVQFSRWMNFEADIWRAEDYIGFVVKFMVGMGLSFELPVALLTLVKIGIIDYTTLSKYRPYWVVVNLVLAALLTPPDVVSQLLMAIPLQVLYEVSVVIAWYWHRRDQKRLQLEEARPD